jgi:hypothetical protein
MLFRTVLHVSLMVGCLSGLACFSVKPIYYADDKAVARKQVEKFHQLYNDGSYEQLYELLTKRVKNEVSKDDFVSNFSTLKTDNGQFIEATEVKSEVVPQAAVREVRIKYSSKFEKGWCDEGFAIFVDENDALVDLAMINPANGPASPQH